MNQAEQRKIALGAVRSEARSKGWKPEELSVEEAYQILDSIYRMDVTVIASIWYGQASDAQYNAFRREWNAWIQEMKSM